MGLRVFTKKSEEDRIQLLKFQDDVSKTGNTYIIVTQHSCYTHMTAAIVQRGRTGGSGETARQQQPAAAAMQVASCQPLILQQI